MKQTQFDYVKSRLMENKRVSRNWALSNYISRLSAIVHTLRHEEHIAIDGEYVGNDYVYTLKD